MWCSVCPGSRPNPGLLVLDSRVPDALGTGVSSVLFKKNTRGLTKMRINPKRALARFVPSQSSPAANVILAHPHPRTAAVWRNEKKT